MTVLLKTADRHLTDDELLAARVARPRRTGQWLAAVVAGVLLAMLVHTVLTNPRFQWAVVGQYFTSTAILRGLVLTLWLTAAVMVCGYLLGTALAVMRLSHIFRRVVLPQAMPAIVPASDRPGAARRREQAHRLRRLREDPRQVGRAGLRDPAVGDQPAVVTVMRGCR
ncbi:hypothetical protein ODJ79_27890 [Actinoplanes sp. KI2]|uniref:hypothetical protein n=1 Tax=Actinoplanes sp. KI2 TaxID=2983315 RepID=UPI0021D5C490|nr:hypothetical protein [Actinoplanes sp. KI2]MCU7727557.1 hypothetical protein [Actinoplanes sp. KI2]